jgi:hypothetical protein
MLITNTMFISIRQLLLSTSLLIIMLVIYLMKWHHQSGAFNFLNVSSYSITFFSDLNYLADVNAGIIQVMQTVDPNAVWYIFINNEENIISYLI